jgi:hypothetical protein
LIYRFIKKCLGIRGNPARSEVYKLAGLYKCDSYKYTRGFLSPEITNFLLGVLINPSYSNIKCKCGGRWPMHHLLYT